MNNEENICESTAHLPPPCLCGRPLLTPPPLHPFFGTSFLCPVPPAAETNSTFTAFIF